VLKTEMIEIDWLVGIGLMKLASQMNCPLQSDDFIGGPISCISQIQTKNLAWMVVLLGASVLSGSLEVIMKIHM